MSPIEETLCLPAPSAFSLAAARLGWSLQDCATLSLHGRRWRRSFRICSRARECSRCPGTARRPPGSRRCWRRRGMGGSKLTVCEAMGGPRERLRDSRAPKDFAFADIAALNTIALEVVAAPGARVVPRAAGPARRLVRA